VGRPVTARLRHRFGMGQRWVDGEGAPAANEEFPAVPVVLSCTSVSENTENDGSEFSITPGMLRRTKPSSSSLTPGKFCNILSPLRESTSSPMKPSESTSSLAQPSEKEASPTQPSEPEASTTQLGRTCESTPSRAMKKCAKRRELRACKILEDRTSVSLEAMFAEAEPGIRAEFRRLLAEARSVCPRTHALSDEELFAAYVHELASSR